MFESHVIRLKSSRDEIICNTLPPLIDLVNQRISPKRFVFQCSSTSDLRTSHYFYFIIRDKSDSRSLWFCSSIPSVGYIVTRVFRDFNRIQFLNRPLDFYSPPTREYSNYGGSNNLISSGNQILNEANLPTLARCEFFMYTDDVALLYNSRLRCLLTTMVFSKLREVFLTPTIPEVF